MRYQRDSGRCALELARLTFPRFERRLCRRNDSWGEVRKGGEAPLRGWIEEGRDEFMLVIAPLKVIGGTGSPADPLAVF